MILFEFRFSIQCELLSLSSNNYRGPFEYTTPFSPTNRLLVVFNSYHRTQRPTIGFAFIKATIHARFFATRTLVSEEP